MHCPNRRVCRERREGEGIIPNLSKNSLSSLHHSAEGDVGWRVVSSATGVEGPAIAGGLKRLISAEELDGIMLGCNYFDWGFGGGKGVGSGGFRAGFGCNNSRGKIASNYSGYAV
jgi:hypothetical protein